MPKPKDAPRINAAAAVLVALALIVIIGLMSHAGRACNRAAQQMQQGLQAPLPPPPLPFAAMPDLAITRAAARGATLTVELEIRNPGPQPLAVEAGDTLRVHIDPAGGRTAASEALAIHVAAPIPAGQAVPVTLTARVEATDRTVQVGLDGARYGVVSPIVTIDRKP